MHSLPALLKSLPVTPGIRKQTKKNKHPPPPSEKSQSTKQNQMEFPSFQFQVHLQHGEAVEVTEGAEEDLVLGGMVQ